MHYYKRDIGKYYKKAGRLTMLQHGSYTMLMDACYDREQFPTIEQAIDWCWATSPDEIEAVKFVLSKFFTEYDGVFKQSHITETLDNYHKNKATNKTIAIKREADRRTKREQTVNEPPPNKELKITNQELITKDQVLKSSPKVSDPVPFQDIVNLYHEKLPELPKCEILNAKRKGYIRRRWQDKEHGLHTLEHWENFFTHIRKSDFLMGKAQSNNGRQPFRANLEWLTNLNNYTKVYEDKYHGQ
ncbi:DUF1376 domain-containing protein [bacterium]|nr:DUF1376 domain-containing protein [bacterium]